MKAKHIKVLLSISLLFSVCLFISGCGDELSDVLDERQTELESRYLLDKVSRIEADEEVNITVPEIYSNPPKILETTEGFKLFYFTRNRSPKALSGLLKSQMGVKTITESAGTNQLIIGCENADEANEMLVFLEKIDVAPIQIKIECMIVENYADLTMDRETRVKVGEFLGKDEVIITGPDSGWGLFPGAALREDRRDEYGMAIGYNSDDIKFLVDMLVSRGYLKVLMNPTVRTLVNKPATIVSRDRVPIEKIVTGRDISPYNITEYTWVEDSLTVTPAVYADGTIGLSTKIRFGSKNTPEGVVQLRIITERGIDLGETRVPIGNSLVVGGFKKSEKFSVVRGFPFLKDLPLIGTFFSSKDFEERGKEITFIITPSVATEGIEYTEMVDRINELHKEHYDESITDTLSGIVTDPFGQGQYSGKVEQMATAETLDRMRAEVEAAQTERDIQQARKRLEEYEAMVLAESESRKKAAAKAKEYADKLKQAQEAKAKLEEAQKQQSEKSKEQIEKAKAEYGEKLKQAEEAKKQAQQMQVSAEENEKKLNTLTAETQKLLDETEKLQQQAKQLEQQKQQAKEAAEKAQREREAAIKAAEEAARKAAEEKAAAQEAARKAAEEEAARKAAAEKAAAEEAVKEQAQQKVQAAEKSEQPNNEEKSDSSENSEEVKEEQSSDKDENTDKSE